MNFWIKWKLGSLVEHYNMRWASKLKPADRLSLDHFIPHIDSCYATWDFHHADLNDGHPANTRMMRIDDEDVPGRDAAQEGLWVVVVVDATHVESGVLQEVASR